MYRCEGLCSPLNPLDPDCWWVCSRCGGQISQEFVNTLLLGIQEEGRNFKVLYELMYRYRCPLEDCQTGKRWFGEDFMFGLAVSLNGVFWALQY
jgi:hypothetical protein